MLSIHRKESEDYSVPPSYLTIDDQLSKRSVKYKRKKQFFFCLVFLWVFSLFLFLALPCFHVKSMDVKGLRNLEKSDLFCMMDVNEKASYLTFDKKESESNLKENSSSLLSVVSFKANVFSSSLEVEEDFPVARVNGTGYFTSGRTFDEMKDEVLKTNLSGRRKEELIDELEKECLDPSLTHVYFAKGVFDEATKTKVFLPFKDTPSSILKGIGYVIYQSENFMTMDVIYHDDPTGKDFLFMDVLYDKVNNVFKEKTFKKDVISACRKSSESMSLLTYHLEEGVDLSVYAIKVNWRSNGQILLSKAS